MNPDTTKIIDRLVLSRDGLRKLDIADYAMIREAREAMADAANALTNYAKTFAVIEQNDQAAAPHMLSAPEGVSEAEKRMGELIQVIDSGAIPGISTPVLREDLNNILLALSSERERAERLADERERLHLLICGGEDAPGFAASLTFDEVKAAHDDYIAMLKSRAEDAETKVKELLGLLAPFLPINAVDTRDYAELSFGDHQTQAMTMQPDDWIALSDAALRWTEEASQGEGE